MPMCDDKHRAWREGNLAGVFGDLACWHQGDDVSYRRYTVCHRHSVPKTTRASHVRPIQPYNSSPRAEGNDRCETQPSVDDLVPVPRFNLLCTALQNSACACACACTCSFVHTPHANDNTPAQDPKTLARRHAGRVDVPHGLGPRLLVGRQPPGELLSLEYDVGKELRTHRAEG